MTGRLFFKVFLWFWLSIVFVSVTLIGLTAATHSRALADEHWQDKYGPRVDLWTRQETEILDQQGTEALRKYVRSFESDPGVRSYVLDMDEKELLARQVPARVLHTLASMSQMPDGEPQFFTEERVIAERRSGPSGHSYVVVVTFPQPSVMRFRLFQFLGDDLNHDEVIRVVAVLLVAGLFCFWLARQITNPIDKLRLATREITNERLDSRVDKKVVARRDELGLLARDFDRMAERIDALVASHRRLLADVSHTLRSPLARLNLALGLARQRANPETSEQLDRIEREADRLNRLIGQLLTLARIDSEVDRERMTVFDLGTVVQEVAADGDYEARNRGCGVKMTNCLECRIKGAPEMLRRAIENVVRNAVRHTAEGTDVEISMDLQRDRSRVVIQVRDRGAGVPADEVAQLFLPFHRSSEGISRDPDGAGLGLAISKRAFAFHGGAATAANAPGGGLAVSLELPVLASEPVGEEKSLPPRLPTTLQRPNAQPAPVAVSANGNEGQRVRPQFTTSP